MNSAEEINAAAAHQAGGPLELFSYEVGEPGPTDVEIDVLHGGICHGDLSMVINKRDLSHQPVVPGQEVIGKIAARGSRVRNVHQGMTSGLGWHSGWHDRFYLV